MDKKKKYAYIGCIAVLVLAMVISAIVWSIKRDSKPIATAPTVPELSEPDRRVVVKEVDKLVEVEKEFTSQIVQDGLRDMGLLITQEYYFTEVMSYSSVKSFLSFDIPITESSYIASYDGTIDAGVDFSKITVTKNAENHTVTVHVPKAEIHSVSIDTDSFTLYFEKSGVGNKVSIADYNTSLSELEKAAKEKAIKKGLLTQADDNAKELVTNFVKGIAGDGYTVICN